MLKLFTSFLLFVVMTSLVADAEAKWHARYHHNNPLFRFLNRLSARSLEDETCHDSLDCPEDFMCDNNNCIAKKMEGAMCLSGKDEECKCGKCTLDMETWTQVCLNEDGDCVDDGIFKANNCHRNSDCPDKYFCDALNDNVCTSPLKAGRMCHSDDQCECKHCKEHKIYTRKGHKIPLSYRTCNI